MGPYEYRTNAPPGVHHVRPVEWLSKSCSLQELDGDLLSSLRGRKNVYQSHADDAEHRMERILARITGFRGEEDAKERHFEFPNEDTEIVGERRIRWNRDELVLALDLYFRHHPSSIHQNHKAVVELSNILNKIPGSMSSTRFRNPNAVYMKLCNFQRFDPSCESTGLVHGGRLEEEVWSEFAGQPKYLRQVSEAITKAIENGCTLDADPSKDDDRDEFPEGKILQKLHMVRERNARAVRKAKEIALRNGSLQCKICGFDLGVAILGRRKITVF